jgi:hypothetical protein
LEQHGVVKEAAIETRGPSPIVHRAVQSPLGELRESDFPGASEEIDACTICQKVLTLKPCPFHRREGKREDFIVEFLAQ